MKKSTKIAIILILIIAIAVVAVFAVMNLNKDKDKGNDNKDQNQEQVSNQETEGKSSNLKIESSRSLENLVNKIYEDIEDLPMVMTQEIDITEDDMVKMYTGLENGEDLEYLVVSEPMMSSQAYSLVLAKVENGVDANKVAKEMSKNVDMRKWICVSAEVLYATSSGDVVCLVMSTEEWAKPVYEKFKELAGNVGREYEETEAEIELPEDMY